MEEDLELLGSGTDPIAEQFETYEDYLDKQITPTDLFYLEDVALARQLVELGYHGNGEIIRREEFEERKKAAEDLRLARLNKKSKRLASAGKALEGFPLLQALAQREEAVRNGKLTTIVFIRDKNARGQEVSGYIDYGHRLKQDTMEAVFACKRRLLPNPQDLSFYNWDTQTSTSNPTVNFQVIADNEAGLLFKNKRDRKVINVDPKAKPGDNSTRTELETDEYLQVVIYDHVTRRRS
ncbi:hypothetical protein WJX72_006501 [[Myrmecia] bisecta]|uniref:Cilia- and flagella-associated protein 299 n=1 Tax=[Myrmecia] bisecta TaxID=41462 RepID=A0AAW1P8C9_9CHLO